MDSVLHTTGRFGPRTLLITTAAEPLTGWAVHTVALTWLQRAADAAPYDGKHSGRAVLATAQHVTVASIKGRRAGRPGTAVWGRAA
ncbi:hypothetical protein ACIOHO_37115 [Streptomyces sp. NPDC087849]|uniref:hypothetical protein n=1 Tax=Streptomyces sp. NPDC087849 TaxID=3365808 RepID=UPI0037F3A7F7